MGAWGFGYFEDDTALDFMNYLEESDNHVQVIIDAFESAIASDELDYEEGCAAIVAAAYVDRQINGTKFTTSDQVETLAVDTFPERYPKLEFSDLKEEAVQALNKLLTDDSELNQLWQENEDDYPSWRQGITQLIDRLQK
jgi:hypothetical protein